MKETPIRRSHHGQSVRADFIRALAETALQHCQKIQHPAHLPDRLKTKLDIEQFQFDLYDKNPPKRSSAPANTCSWSSKSGKMPMSAKTKNSKKPFSKRRKSIKSAYLNKWKIRDRTQKAAGGTVLFSFWRRE